MKHLVHDSMSKDLITVGWETPMKDAYLLMKDKRIRHLLVLDRGEQLVGIISDRDFMRASQTAVQEEGGIRFLKSEFYDEDRVVDYMRWPVRMVTESTTLLEVNNEMIERKISCLAVARNDQVVGVITHEDLLRVLRSFLEKDSTPIGEKLKSLVYSTPVGKVLQTLADAGI